MKKLFFLALFLAFAFVCWRNQARAKDYAVSTTRGAGEYLLKVSKRIAGETAPDDEAAGAAFDDVYFLRTPVDTSAYSWNGVLRVGTVVRKLSAKDRTVLIETAGGAVAVDESMLTRDPKEIASLKDSAAHSPPPSLRQPTAPTSAPAPVKNVAGEASRIQKQISEAEIKISSLSDELRAKETEENNAKRGGHPVYGTSSTFLRNEIARLQSAKLQLQDQLNKLYQPH